MVQDLYQLFSKEKGEQETQDRVKECATGAPFERLSTDILGPLNESDQGNIYILVVQCYFSKYLELYALPNQEAETVAAAIVSNWIARFGCPLELHSDRGTNYQSATFQHMC